MVTLKNRWDANKGNLIIAADAVTVKHKDYFNMRDLYEVLHEFLVEEGWCSRRDELFPERFYLQKEVQNIGNELWVWWRFEKFPSGIYNSYYKFVMDVDFHVILLKDVEIVRQGVKYKGHHGEPEIKIWGKIITDWQGRWDSHPILKHLHEPFKKRIFKRDMEMHRRQLYREVYRFQEAVKTYFKLRTYLPEPEGQQFWRNEEFE
jgi:hypothetical protein